MKPFTALLTLLAFQVAALAAEPSLAWPRFRGPNGSGIAEDQQPPVQLGPDKNVKWKTAVPPGLSSPIVAGEHLVITAFENGKLFTIAYRSKDGTEAWRAQAPANQIEAFHKREGSPAASTPATDGRRVVSYFGSAGLFCYDLDGKELWKYKLPTVSTAGDFGTGVSPIVADGTVVLLRDEMRAPRIIAVDAATGTLKWETKRLSVSSYGTPLIWENDGSKHVVAPGHVRLIGYDLQTGAERWFYNGLPSGCCNSPILANNTLFFAGGGGSGPDETEAQIPKFDDMLKDLDSDKDSKLSRAEGEKAFEGFFDNQDGNKDGYITRDEWDQLLKFMTEGKNSAFALKGGGSGDVTAHLLWSKTKGLPYISSAIVYQGRLIMIKDGGILTAYDTATGEQVFQERVGSGTYYASPVAANGNVYFTSLLGGAITVVNCAGEKPQVVASNPKLGERTAATPAIANHALYVRTEKHLYAFSEK